jgi:methyl-accepting chemotaxis protein
MTQYKNHRRKLIISKLQWNMILSLSGLIIGVSFILATALFFIFKSKISMLSVSEEVINQFFSDSMLAVVITAVILFIISFWAVVLISHKIYGPLYRFGLYLKKLRNGEITEEIQFRKYDAVNGLKDIYNDLRGVFEKTLKYDYKEMVSTFTELQNILDKVHSKQLKDEELAQSLQNVCDRIANALDITSEVID